MKKQRDRVPRMTYLFTNRHPPLLRGIKKRLAKKLKQRKNASIKSSAMVGGKGVQIKIKKHLDDLNIAAPAIWLQG